MLRLFRQPDAFERGISVEPGDLKRKVDRVALHPKLSSHLGIRDDPTGFFGNEVV